MVTLYLLFGLMALAAVGFVVVPWLRDDRHERVDRDASNLAVLRQQRADLLAEHARGELTDAERDAGLDELARRAARDLDALPEQSTPHRTERKPWITFSATLILIPVTAALLYWRLGAPAAVSMPSAELTKAPPTDQQILAMVESLAAKMKERPDDAQGWMLLARSHLALGRHAEAVKAFENANRLVPNNPQLLADHADALAMSQGGNIDGKPWDLIQAALKADPNHLKALAMAGTVELNRRNLSQALGHWRRLQGLLEPGSEDAKQVAAAVLEVELAMQGGSASTQGQPGAAPMAKAAVDPANKPAVAAKPGITGAEAKTSVTGQVTISPELAKQVALTDTLFIFARASNWNSGGPRVPLAVLRAEARELPRKFELTDGMAMAPNVRLSDFPEVVVEARISKSGNAQLQPGDLQGLSAPIKPGARNVALAINKVVK